ncbi:MAG: nuclear transport factor 2 family protein [Actinomycetota bacterium]
MTPTDRRQAAKATVLDFQAALDAAAPEKLASVIAAHTHPDYRWRGVHPFGEHQGAEAAAKAFWSPLRAAMAPVQRRPDVFLAGVNDVTGRNPDDEIVWVAQMGHHLGLFDRPWLDIPPTGRMCFLRYAEFNAVHDGRIIESAIFVDVISVMRQAGRYPLPPQTGSSHLQPGPLTHDGLLLDPRPDDEGTATMDLVNRMVGDLGRANEIAIETGDDRVPREVLARTWHEDMIWSGPEGIGATYTIDRYQHQHQYPFRFNLASKAFNGHVARLAEGDYACFFGWPNLTNVSTGGFLGLPGSETPADMRVVDVYRRRGDKLAENWVFIDLPHWLLMQGLDVLERMRQLDGEAF